MWVPAHVTREIDAFLERRLAQSAILFAKVTQKLLGFYLNMGFSILI